MASTFKIIFLLTSSVIISVYYFNFTKELPALPKFTRTWWGPEDSKTNENISRRFYINVSDEVLTDLYRRLGSTHTLVPPIEDTQNYGINTNLLSEVITFWKTKYNWRLREKFLNKFPQFLMNIQGLDIHYIHVKYDKPHEKTVLPLILLHGWPGSIREFYEIIPILTTPNPNRNFIFEVVVPSIPGYGFSTYANRPGLGGVEIAIVLKNFMQTLGFQRFYAQGGDLGAIILHHLAILYPETILGFHSNFCVAYNTRSILKIFFKSMLPTSIMNKTYFGPRHHNFISYLKFLILETGYLHMHTTKPDTVGVGMSDSPAALLGYILEKIITGTNFEFKNQSDGGFGQNADFTNILDIVMIYWVTNSMPTAMRLYAESLNERHMSLRLFERNVLVPTACARFKNDFYCPDDLLYSTYQNLVHIAEYDGGHFAAFLSPETLAQDIFIAMEKFTKLQASKTLEL